jgi:hypothetical protein
MNRDLGAQAFTQRAPLIQRIGGKQPIETAKKWFRSKQGGGKESPAEDIEQVNPKDFRDYIDLDHIEAISKEIPSNNQTGHEFFVTFTLRNKTEKRIEFTDIPPVEWIETIRKVEENEPEVHLKMDMYKENPKSNTFRSWSMGFGKQWDPGETKKVYILDVPSIGGTNKDKESPRTVSRNVIFDIGLPGPGPRLRATQHIKVVKGDKQEVKFTID